MFNKNKILLSLFLFYFAWWSILILAWKQQTVGYVFITIVALLLHFLFISHQKAKDAFEILLLSSLGVATSYLLIKLQLITLTDGTPLAWPFLWDICLSLVFSTTVSYAFLMIRQSLISQIVIGFFLAPLAYFTASKFFMVTLYEPVLHYYLIHGIIWAIYFPLCFFISKKIKGH